MRQVNVRIGTAATNPRPGGNNNLSIEIHFTNKTIQTAPNVNHSIPWTAGSSNVVKIPLSPTMPLNTIKRIRLVYNPGPAWGMAYMRARAVGSAVSAIIAKHGQHTFSTTYPALGVYTTIPSGACLTPTRRFVAGPRRVAPGTPVEFRGLITNEKILQMVHQGTPESQIIAAIRQNPTRFDLSPNGRMALERGGVSRNVFQSHARARKRPKQGYGRLRQS